MAIQAAELKMPQTGAAQREPSMEEILASIRRIIEDSDQAKRPEPETPAEPAGMTGATETVMVADPLPKTPTSIERLMEGEPRSSRVAEPAAYREPPVTVPSEPPAQAPVDTEAASDDGIELSIELDDEIDAALPPLAANSQESEAEPKPLSRPAIISERASRQVAAAFEELSDAFAASRRKSFDEMAEEMMRPMLQDWLDNNLPTLVEKLVREEIERVARGAA